MGYWPETLYGAPSDEAIQREIRLAKEAGLESVSVSIDGNEATHDRLRGGHFIQEDQGPEIARRMVEWMAG
mgnify:CR=1 FL=1